MKIGNREIGGKTFIIAEAGIEHYDQSPVWRRSNAMNKCNFVARYPRMKYWGRQPDRPAADAIKFQMFVPDEPLFCPLDGDDQRKEKWEKSCMKLREWREVKEHVENCGLVFMASAFQPTAVEWLNELGVVVHKVASRAVKTYPYDDATGPFLISLGMAEMEDVPQTKKPLDAKFLQCDTHYPCKPRRWEEYDGLSDHSGDVFVGIDAIRRGCPILEVHVDFQGTVRFWDDEHAIAYQQEHGHEINHRDMELLYRARDESILRSD